MRFNYDDWSFTSRLKKKYAKYISGALFELIDKKDVFEFVETVLIPAICDKLYDESEKTETVKVNFNDGFEVSVDVTHEEGGTVISINGGDRFFRFGKYKFDSDFVKLKYFLLKEMLAELNECEKFSPVLNSLMLFELLHDNVTYALFLWHCFSDFSLKYYEIQSANGIKETEDFFSFEDFISNPSDYYGERAVKEFIIMYKDCFGVDECGEEFIYNMVNEVKKHIENERNCQ